MSVLLGDLSAAWRAVNEVQFARYLFVWTEQLCALLLAYPKFYQRCAAPDGVASTACVPVRMH
jgi:hypothetical protein